MENKETEKTAETKVIREFLSDVYNEGDPKESKTLVIRTGAAPRQLDAVKPNKVHISGVIGAPNAFYQKRKSLHSPTKCHVLYDKNKGFITLVMDEQFNQDNYVINGQIILNPDLEEFNINAGKDDTFTIKGLMDVLKFNRVFFSDKDDNAKVVLALQNFKAKIEHTIEDSTNLRGNENQTKITKLEHDLQESFVLIMPIHKGGNNCTFRVDICCQVRDRAVCVWLESRELKELLMGSIDKIMEDELANFTDIVCIEQ